MTRFAGDGGTTLLERTTKKTAPARPVFLNLSRNDKLESVALMFDGCSKHRFRTVPDIEGTDPAKFRATAVDNTIFEPIANHLTKNGVPTKTIGGVMDALTLTHDEAHAIACFCHQHSETIDGELAAYYIRSQKN